MAYVLSKESFLKKLNPKLKKSFSFVKKMDDNFFAEDKFSPNKTKIYSIKVSKENFDKVPVNIGKKPSEKDIEIDGIKIRFIVSGKKSVGRKGDAKTTKMQELCSLKIAQNVYSNKPTSLEELVKIYPDLVENKSWQESFKAQEKVFKEIKNKYKHKPTIFNRDGGFMDDITKLVKKFGISQKDAWNPADIWLLNKESNKIFSNKFSSISELNAKMRELFYSGDLLGISLKKTKKTAKYELVNLEKTKFSLFNWINGNLLLSLKPDNTFTNDELNYDLKSSDGIINTQIRMYPKKEKSNVQVSYKMKGGVAEFGKVPAAFRNEIFKQYTSLEFPKGKEMIQNFDEFLKQEKQFKKEFDSIKRCGYFTLGVKGFEEFKENLQKAFTSNTDSYILTELNTKMQGFKIAYGFSKLNKTKLDELVTKWGYLSQKKGDVFGPFIKVY